MNLPLMHMRNDPQPTSETASLSIIDAARICHPANSPEIMAQLPEDTQRAMRDSLQRIETGRTRNPLAHIATPSPDLIKARDEFFEQIAAQKYKMIVERLRQANEAYWNKWNSDKL